MVMATQNTPALPDIMAEPNLFRAWERVAQNHSAPGIDKVTVDDFARRVPGVLHALRREVLENRFRPQPLVSFPKAKPNGGFRELTIATVRDRVVSKAAAEWLTFRFDRQLQPNCYAYRPGRGALKAVAAASRGCRQATHAVRVDIENFFDTIDHELLNRRLLEIGLDEATRRLLLGFVCASRFDGVRNNYPRAGVPQGSTLAPVLANLYLDPLDRALTADGYTYLRYADDILVLARKADDAAGALSRISYELNNLNLRPSTNKSRVYTIDEGFLFLGFVFNRQGHVPSDEARTQLEHKLAEAPYADESDAAYRRRLEAIARGWRNYFEPDAAVNMQATTHTVADTAPAAATIAAPVPEPEPAAADATETETTAAPMPSATEGHRETGAGQTDPTQAPQPAGGNPLPPTAGPDRIQEIVTLRECGYPGEAVNRLRRLLSSEDAALTPEETTRGLTLLADLYDSQGLHGAAGRCRKEGGRPETRTQTATAAVEPDPQFGARDVDTWMELFGGGHGGVYRQYLDRVGRHGFKPAVDNLTAAGLRDHWRGWNTLAVPIYDQGNRVRFGLLDLDVLKRDIERFTATELEQKRTTMLADAQGVLAKAHQAGVEGVIEDSGYKGYHVWFFFHDRLEAALVRRFLATLDKVAGPPPAGTHRELFPGADQEPPDGLGARVKLPLGIHRVTGRRSHFLAPDGVPCGYETGILGPQLRNRAVALKQAINRWAQYADVQTGAERGMSGDNSQASPAPADSGSNEASRDPVTILYAHCAVLRGLRAKAEQNRRLSHYERTVIRGILEPLGATGRAAVHEVMRQCANYNHAVTERMMPGHHPALRPMGCARIQEVLGTFCAEVGCTCRFKPRKNEYAHPLRHLGTVAAHGDTMSPGRAAAVPHPRPPATADLTARVSSGDQASDVSSTPGEGRTASAAGTGPFPAGVLTAAPISHAGADTGLATCLAAYREARQRLLQAQASLLAELAGRDRVSFAPGVLRLDGCDPAVHHIRVELE